MIAGHLGQARQVGLATVRPSHANDRIFTGSGPSSAGGTITIVHMPRREPPQRPAPAQRLRVCHSKLGVARFASHRDFARAFERALRRAEVPMAYSSGFSPHPRISYANAAPTSAQSLAEYLDIGLVERRDPADVAASLNAALPHGFRVVRVIEACRPRLSDLLQASRWWIDLGPLDENRLKASVVRLLAVESAVVTRHSRKADRILDARPAVLSMEVRVPQAPHELVERRPQVVVTLAHGEPLVRPDDVVAALRALTPGLGTDHPGLFTRQCQGPLREDGSIADPLEPDE